MYQPTVQASVPALASEANLTQANGLVSGIGAISALVGPVLGGVLYGLVGVDALLVVSCAAFAGSAAFELFMRIPFARRPSGRGMVATLADDVRAGLRFARRDNPLVMKIILLACALNMLAVPAFIIGVPYVLRFTLRSSDLMYGIGLGCTELATIVGAIFAGRITRGLTLATISRPVWLFALLTVPMALAMTPAVLSWGYWPAFALFFASEMAAIVVVTAMSVFAITEIQKTTPNDLLGKVMGILLAGSQIAAPLGQMLYGLAFEAFTGAVWIPLLLVTAFAALIAAAAGTMLTQTPKKASNHDTSGLTNPRRISHRARGRHHRPAAHQAWVDGLSPVATDPDGQIVARCLLTRCVIGQNEALMLGPAAVLPAVQKPRMLHNGGSRTSSWASSAVWRMRDIRPLPSPNGWILTLALRQSRRVR
jgi:predicted lipid-binding transport protein (Tim44 family)